MENSGERFLHKIDPKLHTSESVERAKEKKGLKSQKPEEKIAVYLERLKKILEPNSLKNHPNFDRKERNINLLKRGLHNAVIIKPENIPESYFDNQRRLAREQGYGDIEITEQAREQATEVIITDQKSTLDNWIEYLTHPDSNSYPMWAKYWAFEGMLKLSSYNKEKHSFNKREKNTIALFPDLNREALAYVIDAIIRRANQDKTSVVAEDPKFQQLLQGANFGKLYAWAIEKVTPAEEHELLQTKGEWITHRQGSDHMPLVNSLQGHGTGWCTAGEETAKSQLKLGDFHVYYSYDKEGKPTIPRIAIRMENQNITEVRGIAHEQHLDPQISKTDILDKKLENFGTEGEAYQKKSADMRKLTELSQKANKKEEFTKEDLKFLYEIESKIQGFGYGKDPRIEELHKGRNIKKDIAFAIGCLENEVSITQEEALRGGIKYHYSDLDLYSLTSTEGLTLPETVGGNLVLSGLTSAEGLTLPKTVGGDLSLSGLISAEGLIFPETVGGRLNLSRLTSAEGLMFPETVGGGLYLSSLTSAEGLTLPKTVGGSLDLYSLTSTEGLTLPEIVEGGIYLNNIPLVEKEELRKRYPHLSIY